MLDAFVPCLREGLQCAFLLLLVLGLPAASRRATSLMAGVAAAFAVGFSLSYVPGLAERLWTNETWRFLRNLTEVTLIYLGLVLAVREFPTPPLGRQRALAGLAGFALFFFEARGLGFLVHDIGLMKEQVASATALGLAGTLLGFVPLLFAGRLLKRLPLETSLTLPSLVMLVAALKFAVGGVGELEDVGVMTALQLGLQFFLESAVDHLRHLLMIGGHPFLPAPLAGLAGFLSGDRTALSLVVLLVTAPPVYLLVRLVSRPDPELRGIRAPAERRLEMAFFRRDFMHRSAPVLAAFVVILVQLHAANISLNPLTEPVPIPVREADREPGLLRISLSDRLGDFSDGKLRKYVYYHGSKQILFLAIQKPDGTVGVALDECEICRPAEWNKAAQGYAQRGDHLVCKYCMTPIPIPTVNKPGGCNPIPVPFRSEEGNILITVDDLVRVNKSAKELQKKGTHL